MHPSPFILLAKQVRATSFLFPALGIATLVCAGCASSASRPTVPADGSDRVVLTDSQVEYVYVTGSTLPILAAKRQLDRTTPQTASPVVTISPDAFRRMGERALASSGR